jgi:hypothetical protein
MQWGTSERCRFVCEKELSIVDFNFSCLLLMTGGKYFFKEL